jgi:hypothetical protein
MVVIMDGCLHPQMHFPMLLQVGLYLFLISTQIEIHSLKLIYSKFSFHD